MNPVPGIHLAERSVIMLHTGRKFPKHSVFDRDEFLLQLAAHGLQPRARTSSLTTYLHPLTLPPSTPGSTTGRYKQNAFINKGIAIAIAILPLPQYPQMLFQVVTFY